MTITEWRHVEPYENAPEPPPPQQDDSDELLGRVMAGKTAVYNGHLLIKDIV